MAMEISGRVIKVLPEVTGQGKNGTWIKQEFLIETTDQYPKKVLISAWGNQVDSLRQFGEGADVKVSFNLESREYNNRYYTDVRSWRIEAAGAPSSSNGNRNSTQRSTATESNANVSAPPADDLPF